MSALAHALKGAGLVSTEDRLRDIALRAAQAADGNWEDAVDLLFAECAGDAALLMLLIQPLRAKAAQPWLQPAHEIVRTEKRAAEGSTGAATIEGLNPRSGLSPPIQDAGGSGQTLHGSQVGRARPVQQPDPAQAGGRGGQRIIGAHVADASPPKPSDSVMHRLAARSERARKTIYDTFQTEFGELKRRTRDELSALGRRGRTNAWFFEALMRDMPPHGHAIVSEHVSAERAEELWRLAQLHNSLEALP